MNYLNVFLIYSGDLEEGRGVILNYGFLWFEIGSCFVGKSFLFKIRIGIFNVILWWE